MIEEQRLRLADNHRVMRRLAAIQVFCGAVFAADILYEVHLDFFLRSNFGLGEFVHLGFEAVATFLLFVGYILASRQARRLRQIALEKEQMLVSLRGNFDTVLSDQFEVWKLSAAEQDVALLSLRGLKITEIASIRETQEGTVKAQLSAIFRKAGVTSRNELLGHFMEEFLEFGAGNA